MKLPEKYTAARKALAEARNVDEVKNIHDKAIAMAIYAKQAKDGELIGLATDIRKRAERRLGEMMAAAPKAKAGRKGKNRVFQKPNLEKQGIDKNLADRARKAAAKPAAEFEKEVSDAKKLAVAVAEGDKAVVRAAKDRRHQEKKKKRAQREKELGAKIQALPQKRYGVIVADPEWKFEAYSERGFMNSAAANHYTVSPLEVIAARDIPSISANDCALFLWATVPMLPHALHVMGAWGFEYKSHFAWVKDRAGTGYWGRNKHELLLIGTKGKIVAPAEGTQPESAISAAVGEHSAKPEIFLEIIEDWFPNIPKIELNRRGPARNGWDAWGNEVDDEQKPQVRGSALVAG